MADNRRDTPEFNSLSAKAVRTIDTAENALHAYFKTLSFGKGVGGIALAATLATGSAGIIGGGLYMFQDEPVGGITNAGTDYDISGKGFMNRTYSFTKHTETHFMLIRDEGRTELYQWNDERRRIEIVRDYALARQIVEEVSARYERQIAGFNLNADSRYSSDFMACSTIENPMLTPSNATIRHYSGCTEVTDKSASQITTLYQQTQSFWQSTAAQMTPETYGPAADRVTRYVAPDDSGTQSAFDLIGDAAMVTFAAWLGLGAAGAGISGLRRRAGRNTSTKNGR